MQAVQLCCNKIFQYVDWVCQLTQVDPYNGNKMAVVILFYAIYRYVQTHLHCICFCNDYNSAGFCFWATWFLFLFIPYFFVSLLCARL